MVDTSLIIHCVKLCAYFFPPLTIMYAPMESFISDLSIALMDV